MKQFILLYLAFLLFPIAVSTQTIKGRVSDSNGNSLPQAHVMIKGGKSGSYSNNDGNYEIKGLKRGSYTLVASYVGHIAAEKEVEVGSESVVVCDFVLSAVVTSVPAVVVKAVSQSEIIGLPVRITTLEAKDIISLPAVSTPEILASVSGVHVHSDAGIFSSSSVNIRGVGGSSQTGTLVMVDGIPVNKSDGGSVNWNLIDKDRISRIEIVKGPGSALFGSNAMGGVINVISDEVGKEKGGEFSAAYGTYNTFDAKGQWQGGVGKSRVYYKLFSNYRTSDGYINTPEEVILENDSIVVPVFLDELFFGGLVGTELRQGESVEMSLNFFKDIRGRGTKVYEDEGSFTQRNTLQGYTRYRRQMLNWDLKLSVYGHREDYNRLNEYLSDGEYKLYEVQSKRDDAGFRGIADRQFKNERVLTIGAEFRSGKVVAEDIYYTSTDIISNRGQIELASLFSQFIYPFKNKKWKTVLGLRYDYAYFHDGAFDISYPSYSVEYFTDFAFKNVDPVGWGSFSPKLTLRYAPLSAADFYVTVAKGFRAPVLDDLCRSERIQQGLRVANPGLKPEFIWHYEAGSDIRIAQKVLLQVSAYHTLGHGFMHPLSTGDSVNLGYTLAPIFKITNIAKAGITGLEADISTEITKRLFIFGNYTYTKGVILEFNRETEADRDLTGKFLANLPAHRFSAGGKLSTGWFDFSATLRHTGARWVREDNEVDKIYLLTDRYPAYTTLDLGLRKEFAPFVAGIDVENIFDVVYVNGKGYKSPGRMIFAKVQYKLKM